ncbi:MAG TPA: MFS transporter [Candidatus Aphodousia faecavium]|nr:MFS transporter [Candidatus Aphodousia faecavium]
MMTEARKQDILLITLLGVAHGLSHYFHLIIPPLFPWIMPEFGTTYAEMGAVMTVFFITSSLGQAASGIVVDKLGPRVCLYGGVGLLMIAGFLFSVAQNYWWFFPVAACAGLGNSVFHPTDFSIINRCITNERLPFAFSIHSVVGNIGWALAPIFMVGVAGFTGSWRLAAATAGLMALIVLAVLILHNGLFEKALREGNGLTPEEKKVDEKGDVGFGFLKLLVVWLCFLFFFCNSFALGILQNFAPSIFNATYHVGLEIATGSLTAYMIGSIIGVLLGAYVAKAFKRSDHVVAASMSVSAIMAILLASQWLGPWCVLPLMAVMGFGVGLATPSRDLLIRGACMTFLGSKSFGRVYGFTYCGMDVGQTLAPLVAGPLLDAGFFSLALVLVGTFQTGALLTALGVGQQKEKAH